MAGPGVLEAEVDATLPSPGPRDEAEGSALAEGVPEAAVAGRPLDVEQNGLVLGAEDEEEAAPTRVEDHPTTTTQQPPKPQGQPELSQREDKSAPFVVLQSGRAGARGGGAEVAQQRRQLEVMEEQSAKSWTLQTQTLSPTTRSSGSSNVSAATTVAANAGREEDAADVRASVTANNIGDGYVEDKKENSNGESVSFARLARVERSEGASRVPSSDLHSRTYSCLTSSEREAVPRLDVDGVLLDDKAGKTRSRSERRAVKLVQRLGAKAMPEVTLWTCTFGKDSKNGEHGRKVIATMENPEVYKVRPN